MAGCTTVVIGGRGVMVDTAGKDGGTVVMAGYTLDAGMRSNTVTTPCVTVVIGTQDGGAGTATAGVVAKGTGGGGAVAVDVIGHIRVSGRIVTAAGSTTGRPGEVSHIMTTVGSRRCLGSVTGQTTSRIGLGGNGCDYITPTAAMTLGTTAQMLLVNRSPGDQTGSGRDVAIGTRCTRCALGQIGAEHPNGIHTVVMGMSVEVLAMAGEAGAATDLTGS